MQPRRQLKRVATEKAVLREPGDHCRSEEVVATCLFEVSSGFFQVGEVTPARSWTSSHYESPHAGLGSSSAKSTVRCDRHKP